MLDPGDETNTDQNLRGPRAERRTLSWHDRRRIARDAKRFHAWDSRRLSRSRSGVTVRQAGRTKTGRSYRYAAVAVAGAILVILGISIGIEHLVETPIAFAHPLWRVVPDGWSSAEVLATGGETSFEDPIALCYDTARQTLLVGDPYKDTVFQVDSAGAVTMLLTKSELEYYLGLSLSGGADGPVALTNLGDTLFVAVSLFEGQSGEQFRSNGSILFMEPSGTVGILRDESGEPVRVPLDAERESHHGLVGKGRALYVTSANGGVLAIQLDESRHVAEGTEAVLTSLRHPTALALDDSGFLYIVDEEAAGVFRLLPNGHLDERFRIENLENPTGLALSPRGDLFVAESGSGGRIQWFTEINGEPVRRGIFERFSEEEGIAAQYRYGFQGPAIAIDPVTGALLVADNTGSPGEAGIQPAVYRCARR